MSQPNIRPAEQPHSQCWRQSWPPTAQWHRVGDVRRCIHGKVQVLTKVSVDAPVQGPGTNWWRTLSPIWNPIDYRRAKEALEQ